MNEMKIEQGEVNMEISGAKVVFTATRGEMVFQPWAGDNLEDALVDALPLFNNDQSRRQIADIEATEMHLSGEHGPVPYYVHTVGPIPDKRLSIEQEKPVFWDLTTASQQHVTMWRAVMPGGQENV